MMLKMNYVRLYVRKQDKQSKSILTN